LHRLTRDPLSLEAVLPEVGHPQAGALCFFLGVVRDNNEGRSVTRIQYEAYEEMALEQLGQVEAEIRAKFPVTGVAVLHRLGMLSVGEASVLIAVSSGHRDASFQACRYGIDRVKELVPIWKKEFTSDGTSWVGLQ
jgi:molybdopterin synthase catalytic subunit